MTLRPSTNRYAFCVGVDTYDRLPALRCARSDATSVFDVLTDAELGNCSPENSVLLIDEPKQTIEDRLERFLTQRTHDDVVVLFFACHGQLSRDLGLFLCASDSDPDLLGSSATSLDLLDRLLRWSDAEHSLIILDCCFGGAAFHGVRYRGFGSPGGPIAEISGRGRVTMSASDHLQPSREIEADGHGLFTFHLLEGIQSGGADLDSDGVISTSDLYQYCYSSVVDATDGEQRPVYSGIDVGGEFFVSYNRNRRFSALTTGIDGCEMLIVPEGDCYLGDRVDPVQIPAYYIDAVPVTNEAYRKFVRDTGWRPPPHWRSTDWSPQHKDHPVVNVSYQDATGFAEWAGKRLPSSQEWEKAARGPDGYTYPWGNAPTVAKCNVRESSSGGTTNVRNYRSGVSPFGVYDMAGNVWEWCATATSPGRRVLRGGSFNSPFAHARCDEENDALESMMDDDTGFRCAADVDVALGLASIGG